MKLKKQFSRPYGLRTQFILSTVISALFCCLLFSGMYYSVNHFLTSYFAESDFELKHIKKQGKNLQKYVNEHHISSENLSELKDWEHKQPVILLELYDGKECIYSSFYDGGGSVFPYEEENGIRENMAAVQLADIPVMAVMYSDFTYQYYVLGMALSIVLSLLVFIFLFLRSNRKLIRYICRLNEEVQILEGGNLDYEVSVEGNDEITDLAKSMNRMRESFRSQMESEVKLHQANRQLVTEMSHDLRTPLTSIMLYLEILRSHRYSSEAELQDYLGKIDAKAHHMKAISDHLFEYSLETPHEKQNEPMEVEWALSPSLKSFADDLNARGFSIITDTTWNSCFIQINQEYMQRIFENIISNIVKYADPSADIVVSTFDSGKYFGLTVLNVCASETTQVESNGIGIESIRSMMQQMRGVCMVEQTDTIFEITLLFPKQ